MPNVWKVKRSLLQLERAFARDVPGKNIKKGTDRSSRTMSPVTQCDWGFTFSAPGSQATSAQHRTHEGDAGAARWCPVSTLTVSTLRNTADDACSGHAASVGAVYRKQIRKSERKTPTASSRAADSPRPRALTDIARHRRKTRKHSKRAENRRQCVSVRRRRP